MKLLSIMENGKCTKNKKNKAHDPRLENKPPT